MKNRRIEFDIVKFMAIIFMSMIHSIECFENDVSCGAGFFFDIITGGILAAPVFMLCMGFGFAYSRNTSRKYLIRRGIRTFILGYALNIARDIVPLIYYRASRNTEMSLIYLSCLIEGDILQFAGLAMMLTGLLQRFENPPVWALGIGIGLSLVHTFIPVIEFDGIFPSFLTGLFVYTECPMMEMCFPLFGWYIFVGAGYLLGSWLRKTAEPAPLYLKAGIPCFVLSVLYLIISRRNVYGMMGIEDYFYKMIFPDACASLGIFAGCIGLMYVLAGHIPQKTTSFIVRVSSCVNEIYIIHWIIMEWIVHVIVRRILGFSSDIYGAALIGILILFAAVPLGFEYSKLKKRDKGSTGVQKSCT